MKKLMMVLLAILGVVMVYAYYSGIRGVDDVVRIISPAQETVEPTQERKPDLVPIQDQESEPDLVPIQDRELELELELEPDPASTQDHELEPAPASVQEPETRLEPVRSEPMTGLDRFDNAVVSGSQVLATIRRFENSDIAIIVNTLENGESGGTNYGVALAPSGLDLNGVRWDGPGLFGAIGRQMFQVEVSSTETEFLQHVITSLVLYPQHRNTDISPAMSSSNPSFVGGLSRFTSVLVYDIHGEVIGIYFEEAGESAGRVLEDAIRRRLTEQQIAAGLPVVDIGEVKLFSETVSHESPESVTGVGLQERVPITRPDVTLEDLWDMEDIE